MLIFSFFKENWNQFTSDKIHTARISKDSWVCISRPVTSSNYQSTNWGRGIRFLWKTYRISKSQLKNPSHHIQNHSCNLKNFAASPSTDSSIFPSAQIQKRVCSSIISRIYWNESNLESDSENYEMQTIQWHSIGNVKVNWVPWMKLGKKKKLTFWYLFRSFKRNVGKGENSSWGMNWISWLRRYNRPGLMLRWVNLTRNNFATQNHSWFLNFDSRESKIIQNYYCSENKKNFRIFLEESCNWPPKSLEFQ